MHNKAVRCLKLGQRVRGGGGNPGDQLQLSLGEIRGDGGVGQGRAQADRMGRGRQAAVGIDSQTFLFDPPQELTQTLVGSALGKGVFQRR